MIEDKNKEKLHFLVSSCHLLYSGNSNSVVLFQTSIKTHEKKKAW